MGTRIEVLRLAATPVARQVVAGAQVTKVDGRRIEFKIEATEGVAPIGTGTHERMVIDMVRFVERLNRTPPSNSLPRLRTGDIRQLRRAAVGRAVGDMRLLRA